MRAILNAILSFIGAESLTDDEFDAIDIEDEDSNQERYEALLAILVARESVTDMAARLEYYYLAKGIAFGSADVGNSNIFVGSEL